MPSDSPWLGSKPQGVPYLSVRLGLCEGGLAMLRSVSDLKQFTIAAMDGSLGSVSDLYFDDRSWAVRYLVVEAGTSLPSGRVFVPPVSVRSSDSTTLRVALSKTQVKVSSMVNTGDAHLQTATAVMGYAMQAEDGEIGRVKDVLVDDKAWAIRYLVVDTEKWWGGKTVLVSPEWLARVTWDESKTLFCLVTAADDTAAPRALSRRWAG
jgi:sporulation protein YlmC with PRC-barrel domain